MPDLVTIIQAAGYTGLFAIVFAESGLFFGFFLPGDSLLFTAGFLASQDFFNVWALLGITFSAAVLGDSVGYWFGAKVGPKIFRKTDSFFFHKDHLDRANKFYKLHGRKTIILARFMPVIRTFAPIVAGVGKMKYTTFLAYNLVGAGIWAIGLTLVGYFLGSVIPDVDRYLLPIVIGIIVVSLLPGTIHLLKERRAAKRNTEQGVE